MTTRAEALAALDNLTQGGAYYTLDESQEASADILREVIAQLPEDEPYMREVTEDDLAREAAMRETEEDA